jgi:hypothetical protein
MKKLATTIMLFSFTGLVNGEFSVSSAAAGSRDILSEVAQLMADSPMGVRLGPDASRRCFVAVQTLLDDDISSAPEQLAGFLEEVCYRGLRSELERQGILSLFAPLGLEPQRIRLENVTEAQALLASAVRPCWNIDALSTAAQNVSLRVSFELNSTRRPVGDSISLVEARGGDERAIQQAFEVARRAILRCGVDGYPHDLEASEQTLSFSFTP